MKKQTMTLVGVVLVMAACGAEVDDLAPDPEVRQSVELNSTQMLDVQVHDAEGRLYPARVYFNDEAAPLATALAEKVTVLTEAIALPESDPDTEAAPVTEPMKGPWMYLKIGPGPDGISPVGWSAPYSAIFLPKPASDLAQRSDYDDSAERGPSYEALDPFNWFVQSSGAGGPHTDDSAGLQCSNGVAASQTCNWNSFGAGVMSMVKEGSVGDINPNSYSGACTNEVSGATGNGTYRVRNKWASGFATHGNGSFSCI